MSNATVEKLKERVISDAEPFVSEDSVRTVKSERLEITYVYVKDFPGAFDTDVFTLGEYVGAVAFEKSTGDYVGYLEIRESALRGSKKKYVSIPWMFLNRSDLKDGIEKRGKGFMRELMLALVSELRKNVPFYADAKIYSGTSLSDQAVSFFEKMVADGLAKKLPPKKTECGDFRYELTF